MVIIFVHETLYFCDRNLTCLSKRVSINSSAYGWKGGALQLAIFSELEGVSVAGCQ